MLTCQNILDIRKFNDSTHAKIRCSERGLSIQTMKDVVKYHDARKQQYKGEHGGFVYKFSKSAGTETLIVIAEVKKQECWLISGWNT